MNTGLLGWIPESKQDFFIQLLPLWNLNALIKFSNITHFNVYKIKRPFKGCTCFKQCRKINYWFQMYFLLCISMTILTSVTIWMLTFCVTFHACLVKKSHTGILTIMVPFTVMKGLGCKDRLRAIRTNNPKIHCIKPTFSFKKKRWELNAWIKYYHPYLSTRSAHYPLLSPLIISRLTRIWETCAVFLPLLARVRALLLEKASASWIR